MKEAYKKIRSSPEKARTMRLLDTFAGIGGFSLAGHWMGWETAAFVEWDQKCQLRLKKNFPGVPIYGDIDNFYYEQEKEIIGPVDIVCGGFPCQGFSTAGKRKGVNDDRYKWPEMLRVIREVKPPWVIGENVTGILSMGKPLRAPKVESRIITRTPDQDYYEAVLSLEEEMLIESICKDLEGEGYEVQPFVVPAAGTGAAHRRDRIWIIAHSDDFLQRRQAKPRGLQEKAKTPKGRRVAKNGIMKCHYTYDKKTGKVLIPHCGPVAVSYDMSRCVCRQWETYSGFENKKYREKLKEKDDRIKELESEVYSLNRILRKVNGFK